MRKLTVAASALAALAVAASPPAAAHAFGQRYDLPLPLDYFLAGGAAVVLLSFVIAALFLRPADDRAWQHTLPPMPRARTVGGFFLSALGVFLFLLILVAGYRGEQ